MNALKNLFIQAKTRISKPPIKLSSGTFIGDSVTFTVESDGIQNTLFYRSNTMQLSADTSVPLLIVLLQAMKRKRAITLDGPIPKSLLSNLVTFMGIYQNWFKQYRKIAIAHQGEILPKPVPSGRIACFFTGGVDSYYTFLQHKEDITDLIYVHGFDLKLEETGLRDQVSHLGKHIATESAIRFVEIETNARQILKGWGRWGAHSHGLALASVARVLSGSIDKVFIPSSTTADNLFPWGSHPETDHLLGDENLEIIHDSVDTKRTEKTVFISQYNWALKTLRVCYKNTDGAYNCCECEKCLRTMTSLYAVGKLSEATTFPKPLNPELISGLDLSWEVKNNMAKDNLQLLAENGLQDSDIYAAWLR